MSNIKKHFEKELEILREELSDGDKLVIEDFIPEIESIIDKFGKQGHSGSSAHCYSSILSSTIKNVLSFSPLSPLTGKDDEWLGAEEALNSTDREEVYQNIRKGAVFKEGKDGKAYYIDAIVFKGKDSWDSFTGSVEDIQSRQYIKSFPFVPKTFYIDVVREEYDKEKHGDVDYVECGTGDFIYSIKDRNQLKEVFDYYNELKK